MIYLSGSMTTLRAVADTTPGVGFMANPTSGHRPAPGMQWAADNGCFATGAEFKMGRYITWLEETLAPWRADCIFATAPDVLGDAEETWRRSAPILPLIRVLGYPAALVAQDGLEVMAESRRIAWDMFDALFIGGTTEWKLSPAAANLVANAKARGKWVHMGRVNSGRRLRYAAHIGCDSVDGTCLARAPERILPQIQTWLADVKRQPPLWNASVARAMGLTASPAIIPDRRRKRVTSMVDADHSVSAKHVRNDCAVEDDAEDRPVNERPLWEVTA